MSDLPSRDEMVAAFLELGDEFAELPGAVQWACVLVEQGRVVAVPDDAPRVTINDTVSAAGIYVISRETGDDALLTHHVETPGTYALVLIGGE